ncbi:MAG: metallophosphoesterase family protein [Gemmatimonadaceae bacterium]
MHTNRTDPEGRPERPGGTAVEDGDRRLGGTDRRRFEAPGTGSITIAAVGDIHCGVEDAGSYREAFVRADSEADVLVLTGDLTRHGLAVEMRVVVGELQDVKIPVVAVLGNHDYEAGEQEDGATILRARGVHVLQGDTFVLNEHVGFAGVKGFMGGFGRGSLTAFGETETKAFVATALDEVRKLEAALRELATPVRVVVLHYAPIAGTVAGEPEVIFPWLGTDRLAEPLDRFQASVVFHGHAHSGSFRGETAGGIPVFNVALPILRRENAGDSYYLHHIPLERATLSAR